MWLESISGLRLATGNFSSITSRKGRDVCVMAGGRLHSLACGGGASWGGCRGYNRPWLQPGLASEGWIFKWKRKAKWVTLLWGCVRSAEESEAEMNESERAPHSDPSAQGRLHGFNRQSLYSLTWGKQFAHYTFIETQPFITFLPWLCPNEAPEQGLNVTTLLRLLKEEIQDADDAVTLSNGEETLHTTLGMIAISKTASRVGCSAN